MAQTLDRILDELLVIGCQHGDLKAFEKLVARWHVRLKRHAWHLTGDTEASKEIVQDTWLEIVRTIRRLKQPQSFRGWAFRIVSNKATDWMRRQTRQRKMQNDLAHQCEERVITPKQDNRKDDLRRVLQELPEVSRQILSLKYLDNLSTKEIAVALDIPAGTVKSRLFHAREQLRQKIEGDHNEQSG